MYLDTEIFLSYQYFYQIHKIFSAIKNLHYIKYFSLNLIRPDNKILLFSSTPAYVYEMFYKGYTAHDETLSALYYKNYSFYWWAEVKHQVYSKEIIHLRENKFHLYQGFIFVRHYKDFYILYSFATHSQNPTFKSYVIQNKKEYLKIGDFMCTQMQPYYTPHCLPFEAPILKTHLSKTMYTLKKALPVYTQPYLLK